MGTDKEDPCKSGGLTMAVIDLDRKIKQAVQTWRQGNYEGTSPVTRRLLEFWSKIGDGFTFY